MEGPCSHWPWKPGRDLTAEGKEGAASWGAARAEGLSVGSVTPIRLHCDLGRAEAWGSGGGLCPGSAWGPRLVGAC